MRPRICTMRRALSSLVAECNPTSSAFRGDGAARMRGGSSGLAFPKESASSGDSPPSIAEESLTGAAGASGAVARFAPTTTLLSDRPPKLASSACRRCTWSCEVQRLAGTRLDQVHLKSCPRGQEPIRSYEDTADREVLHLACEGARGSAHMRNHPF